ncbi:hypothetical protein [Salinicoccus bachuensis]|uniref:ATP-grasp domain-containing protein n=1 Tax=Salinicoccus bachuensis TaxID=3136731 RepID=A0ABZ3CLL6_9STAP
MLQSEILDLINHFKNEPYKIFPSDSPKSSHANIKMCAEALGMTVKNEDRYTELYEGEQFVGFINKLHPHTTQNIAYRICNDKYLTELFLKTAGYETFNSCLAHVTEYEKAKEYAEKLNGPFVVKPLALNAGDGITADITIEDFDQAWSYCFEAQRKKRKRLKYSLIQPYFKGIDLRVMIVHGRFVSAVLRLPAFIVGDGINTVENLVNNKNKLRKDHLTAKSIKITDTTYQLLKKQHLSTSSIPEKDRTVLLHTANNLSLGGESIEVSDHITEELKRFCADSVKAIPGLTTAGIDVMIKDFSAHSGLIMEANINPNPNVHEFPQKGGQKHPVRELVHGLYELFKYQQRRADYDHEFIERYTRLIFEKETITNKQMVNKEVIEYLKSTLEI